MSSYVGWQHGDSMGTIEVTEDGGIRSGEGRPVHFNILDDDWKEKLQKAFGKVPESIIETLEKIRADRKKVSSPAPHSDEAVEEAINQLLK